MTSFYGEYREKDIISDEDENRVSRANVDKWIFRLLLVLIGFMPLIVLAHVEEVVSPLISDISLLASGNKGDLFTHYKALLILTITLIAGLLLLSKIIFMDGKIRKTKLNYIIGVFVVAIILSTIFSPNITIALDGQYNRSDGAIMWLCYIALMFIAMNINYPRKVVSYVMYSLMPFVLVNLYIITMNFTGHDLMQNTWVQSIVTISLPEGMNLNDGSHLVGTLNQWNYMSGMFAMMTVMYLTWAIIDKKWINSIVGSILASASISIMFMSFSTSGFLTVVVLLPFLICIFLKVDNKMKSALVMVIFLTITIPIFNTLIEKDQKIWNESFGFFFNNNPYEKDEPTTLDFSSHVYASNNVFEMPVLPERSWSAGTGRLYIWEKTLDLIKERPLLGYGLDSLIYNFPHHNIDARSGIWTEDTITDKPHNTYLGVFYGTGIFGFIAVVALLIYFVYVIISNLFKRVDVQFMIFGTVATAYFIQALFNDSLAGVSTVAYIFVGMMISLIPKGNKEEN